MTDRFDVVAVGVLHERAVAVLMVVGALPWRTIVLAVSAQRCALELVEDLAIFRTEGELQPRLAGRALFEPEIWLRCHAQP